MDGWAVVGSVNIANLPLTPPRNLDCYTMLQVNDDYWSLHATLYR